MKRFSLPLRIIFLFVVISSTRCTSQNRPENGNSVQNRTSRDISFAEGVDYTIMKRARVPDRMAFNEPVEAFSLLVPEGWSYEGEIIWIMPGQPCQSTNMWFRSGSADGRYSLTIYPNYAWSLSDDQFINQTNQAQANQFCGVGQPLDAENYIRNVFLPGEEGNPSVLEILHQRVPQEIIAKYEQGISEIKSYGNADVKYYPSAVTAKVKWDDKTEGLVTSMNMVMEMNMVDSYFGAVHRNFNTTASRRIAFRYPAEERERAERLFSSIIGSFRINGAWQNTVDDFWAKTRRTNQLIHINKLNMMDNYTRQIGANAIRQGQKNLSALDQNIRNWEANQQSQDKMHSNFIKAVREVETFRDQTGTYEMNSGYENVWSRNDGSSFIMTDNPNVDPSGIFQDQRWERMKKTD